MARVKSVDVLRGFTIAGMILVNNPGDWGNVYSPLLHASWHGLTPTDLVFPFFLFIVGISISLAYQNKTASLNTYKKIGIRSLKLIGLGLLLNWFLPYFPFFKGFETLRIPGVLQRIGIVFFFAAILFLNCNKKQLLGVIAFILIAYFGFLGFIHLPDGSIPTFDRAANNWANYIDLQFLGKHMWQPDYDPEGVLSTFPAIATSLIGIFIGNIIKENGSMETVRKIFLSALLFLTLGYVWHIWFPINKAIWSSSFVLATAGWASLILAIIYYLNDVRNMNVGNIFSIVGMNAITVFFLSSFIAKCFYLIKLGNGKSIHYTLYNSIYESLIANPKLASCLYALTVVTFYMLLGYAMYRKKIFIKV